MGHLCWTNLWSCNTKVLRIKYYASYYVKDHCKIKIFRKDIISDVLKDWIDVYRGWVSMYTLDRPAIDPRLTSRLTRDQHLNWYSVNNRLTLSGHLVHCRLIIDKVLTNCVDQMTLDGVSAKISWLKRLSTEMLSECWLQVDWGLINWHF